MSSVVSAIRNTVSITQFNRGLAGKIFDEVRRSGPKVVIKNNQPEAVILSPEEYLRLQDQLEDLELLNLATERMRHADPATYISQEEIDREFGFTPEELAAVGEVEIE